MFDMSSLSETAIIEAAKHLGERAAGGAAFSFGAKVFDWIMEHLTGTAEKAAVEKLEKNPDSLGARRALEGLLLSRMKQQPDLAQNLATLFQESGKTLTITGDNNTGIQNVGHGNTITVQK
jgi:hypothetical protein